MSTSHIHSQVCMTAGTDRMQDDNLKQDLAAAGIDGDTVQAALDLDRILQRWRRRVFKRELGVRAVEDLQLKLELPQLDALFAIRGPVTDPNAAPPETEDDNASEVMVSTVASRLNVDPSRASRLTADLIRQGLVERAVSQADARRSVLKLTEAGQKIVHAVRMYKFLTLSPFLSDWTAQELDLFIPLLDRFSAWSEAPDDPSGKIAREIAKLRDGLPKLDP